MIKLKIGIFSVALPALYFSSLFSSDIPDELIARENKIPISNGIESASSEKVPSAIKITNPTQQSTKSLDKEEEDHLVLEAKDGQDESALSFFNEERTKDFNAKLLGLKKELKSTYLLSKNLKNENEIKDRLEKIRFLKGEIASLENSWKKERIKDLKDEEFVFWDQGKTTISDLVMEYGSTDFLYVIPPEVGNLKITLHSQIPMPYESWDEMIKLILSQNGVGIKEVNPFCKQLYVYNMNMGQIEEVVQSREKLALIDDSSRVFYVFSPPAEKMKSAHYFFERFSDKKQTQIHAIGSQIVLVSTKEVVAKLLDLFQAVVDEEQGKKMEVISLSKLGVVEGEKVLKEFFQESMSKGRATFFQSEGQSLKLVTLPHENSLVLIGPKKMIDKARDLIEDVELKLKDPEEMTIYWYTCKHSDPQELAEVLEKVYNSLAQTPKEEEKGEDKKPKTENLNINCKADQCYSRESPFDPVNPVKAPLVEAGVIGKTQPVNYNNFIVDGKTGSILMVVRLDQLERLKGIIEKLDVPKKMVQLDVLLVERKVLDRKKVGVNLLKIGTASGNRETAISFDTNVKGKGRGILDFILSRPKSSVFPAFDLTYQFLLSQDNMQVNANPSVLAINQTPATISVVEEISINNGAVPIDNGNGIIAEQSYSRAQYGITIVITPTINVSEEGEGFVTMQTQVVFDTPGFSNDDRPPVTRRQIKNEVRIADGETVILGGLRRKSHKDQREKIPFLGDIPGLGKLFGQTNMDDSSTEMMFFITPRIIHDPVCDLRKMRKLLVMRRAGDIPEFLEKLESAKEQEKLHLLEKSFSLLWDKL